MDDLIKCFCTDGDSFKKSETEISGLLETTLETFESILGLTGHSFSVRSSSKVKTTKLTLNHPHIKIQQDDGKVFFIIRKKTYYHCSQGKLYYKLQMNKSQTLAPASSPMKKKRLRLRSTKKQDCPATMTVYAVDMFPDYIITNEHWRKKQKILSQLKMDLAQNIVRCESKIFVNLSLFHNHSIVSTELNQKASSIIRTELRRIVTEERNTDLGFINCLLRTAVKNHNIAVSRLSRSVFPNDRTIRSYIAKHSFEKKKAKIDLETISARIDEWAKGGKLFYRPFRNLGGNIEPLLFCYQSNQRDLCSAYGSVVLMDPAYKTIVYSLPLFLLVTKIDASFAVVGFFVVQNDDTRSIAEALRIFRRWNLRWKPDCFVVDCCEADMNAVNAVFREADTVKMQICSFHREQAWERWIKKPGNLANQEDGHVILKLWRAVAQSQDLSAFEANLNALRRSEECVRNEKARRYFEDTWLKVRELWVVAFLDRRLFDSTVDEESRNKLLEHSFLRSHTDKSLSGILEVIVKEYIPSVLDTLHVADSRLSECYRIYDDHEMPEFIQSQLVSCDEGTIDLQVEECFDFEIAEDYVDESVVDAGNECSEILHSARELFAKMIDMTYRIDADKADIGGLEKWLEFLEDGKNMLEKFIKED